MGQSPSKPKPSVDELNKKLVRLFATKCYTQLEVYCFREVFKTLAEKESGLQYWSQTSLCNFLQLPDVLQAGSVVYQLATYLGAFPFPSHAPAILTSDALLKVVTILTGRHKVIIKRPRREWVREIYRGLAVYDKHLSADASIATAGESTDGKTATDDDHGFRIDRPNGDDTDDDDDDDELVLAALESLDISDVSALGEKSNLHHSVIPSDNFLRLIELLLLIAPMEPQDKLTTFTAELDEARLTSLRRVARCILSSFGVDQNAGVTYKNFEAVTTTSLPHLFDPLHPLFEQFLFDKEFDLSKRKLGDAPLSPAHHQPPSSTTTADSPSPSTTSDNHLTSQSTPLPEPGDILTLDLLSQLSFTLRTPSRLFGNLVSLYAGSKAGFSMGSFEKGVFKWQAPSILLVSGTLLPDRPDAPRQKAFAESLAARLIPTSYGDADGGGGGGGMVTYGAYVPAPWKVTPSSAITDAETLLFQLEPRHVTFKASSSRSAGGHVYFCRSPAAVTGVGFGSPVPEAGSSAGAAARRAGRFGEGGAAVPLGPVSLHLDDGLEFAAFTHLTSGGGAFLPSGLPRGAGLPGCGDWQDRFEVDALEVWGCGGTAEAEEQRRAWKWEEAEAERRRRVNLGTGDREMDRELLKMAGIISDGSRSGGSMG